MPDRALPGCASSWRAGHARRRWGAWALLSGAVLLVHLALAAWVARSVGVIGPGQDRSMRKIDVAFVHELKPEPPPETAQAAAVQQSPVVARRTSVASPSAPASAPPAEPADASASAPPPRPDPVGSESAQAAGGGASLPGMPPPTGPPVEPAASFTPPGLPPAAATAELRGARTAAGPAEPQPATGAAVSSAAPRADAWPASAAASAAAIAPRPFEWPPSTRLSYTLVGDYRGPVHGTAQVEWLRQGDRYQVHLQVRVGPLLERRMSSEGEVSDQGLRPRRYQEETRALFRSPRMAEVRFDHDRVRLATQEWLPRLPGVQDTASQFVQLTWLFTTQSHRLRVGESIEMPLALPRRMDRWHYDVQAQQTVDTPIGPLATFHMKPRRATPRPGELSIETWFAPSLQYLPVRILIRQDDETYIDLTLSRAPEQATGTDPAR